MIERANDTAVEVHDLTVSYDKKPVLWDIDFKLPKGEMIGIIGPNGSGKTTLLKTMMGLLPANSGYTEIFGQPLQKVRQRVSYVPQRESVDWDFPATVMDVALMGRYGKRGLFKRLSAEDREVAHESLRKVNMHKYSNRQISQLSGGQQQRVFLARALAQEADLYLMDEPFAGVDAATESSVIELMKQMMQEGKTVVVVHHDLQSVIEYFNWIILLNTRLVASGPSSEVFTTELLEEAYGGKLSVLSRIGDLVAEKDWPLREKDSTKQEL